MGQRSPVPRMDKRVVFFLVAVAAAGLAAGAVGREMGLLTLVVVLQAGLFLYVRRLSRLHDEKQRAAGALLDGVDAALRSEMDSATKRAEQLQRRVEKLQDGLATAVADVHGEVGSRLGRQEELSEQRATRVDERFDAVRSQIEWGLRHHYDQVDALQALYHEIRPSRALPPMGTWAASPDLLRFVYGQILQRPVQRVVECGSGVSTLVMAYALDRAGGEGRIIALEHAEEYLEQTVGLLEEHGLSHLAEVRHAPLEECEVDGHLGRWYAQDQLPSGQIDLVFVDGPPAHRIQQARYPAVPLLYPELAEGALVVMDDYGREGEREVVERWREAHPDLLVRVVPHQKGTVVLERPRSPAEHESP